MQLVSQIVGEEPLPWDDPAKAKQLLKSAGHYRDPLLTLLRRDPQERPSIRTFLQRCNKLAATSAQATNLVYLWLLYEW
jgi:ABC-type transport system substrate-binding protein